MKILIMLFICLEGNRVLSQSFSDTDLDFMNLVHRAFCGAQSLCTSQDKVLARDNVTAVRSLDDLPVPVPDYLFPSCCQSCSCDSATCHDFGNCCPDILDYLPSLEESKQAKKVSCQTTSLRAVGNFFTYWVYQLCSHDFIVSDKATAEIKSKCENPGEYNELDVKQVVTDLSTQRTFVNRYCALCNSANISALQLWTMKLSCYDGDTFTGSADPETLVQDVLNTKKCDLEFILPTETVDINSVLCRTVVTECNVTGDWVEYDPLIEAACHAYRADYNFVYNNVFCFQCNAVSNPDGCVDRDGQGVGTLSFSAVLDFNSDDVIVKNVSAQCLDTQVYDHFKEVCRDLSCIFPRILHGGECINIGDDVTEVAYSLQLRFQPIGVYAVNELDGIIDLIKNYTVIQLEMLDSLGAVALYNLYYKFSFQIVPETTTALPDGDTSNTPVVTTSDADVTATASNTFTKDNAASGVQSIMPDTLATNTVATPPNLVNIQGGESANNSEITLRATLAVEYVLCEIHWYFTTRISGSHSAAFLENVLQLDETNATLDDTATGRSIGFSIFVADYTRGQFGGPFDPKDNAPLSTFPTFVYLPNADRLQPIFAPIQTLKPTLICPLIKLESSEYNISENLSGIYVAELDAQFDRKTFYTEVSGVNTVTYSICKTTYISVTDRYIRNITVDPTPKSSVTPQGILSVICACVSIICAILTLVTYALFSELRTQPGINNIFLCFYLIFAQALFTFAAPQQDSVSEWACSLIGALVHFFWLMVVFAMNVCCYHMVMVLIRQRVNRTPIDSRLVKTVLYNVYCVLGSLVFVSINIIVAVVETENAENGYGVGVCYISRPKMVGYVFALPLGMLLVVNLVYFVTVIVKISRSPTVNSNRKKDRNNFKIYAKLSTVTGLSWIFGFLFEFTDQAVFEYFFIILNAGIGVLIFLSFVCNRRVYNLYKGKISKPVSRTDTSTDKSLKTKETMFNSVSERTSERKE